MKHSILGRPKSIGVRPRGSPVWDDRRKKIKLCQHLDMSSGQKLLTSILHRVQKSYFLAFFFFFSGLGLSPRIQTVCTDGTSLSNYEDLPDETIRVKRLARSRVTIESNALNVLCIYAQPLPRRCLMIMVMTNDKTVDGAVAELRKQGLAVTVHNPSNETFYIKAEGIFAGYVVA